jgi:pimeloyl-ACP methyl ester carboxylesterase
MRTTRRRFLEAGSALAASALVSPVGVRAQPRRPMRDIVVILPGIMGSVLQKDGRDVWALSGGALLNGLKTLGGSVAGLTLTGDSAEAETLDDGIVATRLFADVHLIPGFWKIDGYTMLAKAITEEFRARAGENYFEFPYDWRRDNRAAARRLARLSAGWLESWRRTSGNPDAKLILIAHSMGGLVARYFLEVLEGWRDTRMLVTFGTPYRGSLKALDAISNGLKKTIGAWTAIDMSGLVRSLTSAYQLLPIYPCYTPGTGALQRVAESDGIPNVDAARAKTALAFHDEIRLATERNELLPDYRAGRYTLHPIVGTYQPTLQIARRAADGLALSERYPGQDIEGDGTVPQVSATPIESDALTNQHHRVFVAETHGSLQNSVPMLDHLKALLAEGAVAMEGFRGPTTKALSLKVDDLFSSEEAVRFEAGCADPDALVTIVVTDAQTGREALRRRIDGAGSSLQTVDAGRLAEGTYRVRAFTVDGGTVSDVFVVMEP